MSPTERPRSSAATVRPRCSASTRSVLETQPVPAKEFVSTIKHLAEPRGYLPLRKGGYGSADSR